MPTDMGKVEGGDTAKAVDELITKLQGLDAGFDPAVVDGSWQLVFTRNSNDAPKVLLWPLRALLPLSCRSPTSMAFVPGKLPLGSFD